ncbi:MAG: acyl-CoA dehydrogenase family protein [Desulfobacterales bacterium]
MIIENQLTMEEKLLQQSIRDFIRHKIAPIADDYDRRGPMQKNEAHGFIKQLVPFGLVGATVAEALGGPGLTHRESAVAYYELTKTWMSLSGIVLITSSIAWAVASSQNQSLIDNYLKGLLNGDLIGCFALTEPDAGSDPSSIQTTAVDEGDHYLVNGTKLWISNGEISDLCLCICRESDAAGGAKGILALLVDRRQSPYTTRNIHKLGFKAFPTSELVFTDCKVPKNNVLYASTDGFAFAQRALIYARINAAIASCAIAEASLEKAVAYARERVQFGAPIGKKQMIQQLIAEMMIELEAGKLMSLRSIEDLDQGILSQLHSSIAKAYATEMGVRVTSKAIQIFGAYGLAEDYPLERYFRDARMLTIPDGSTQIQYLIIARKALKINAL